MRQRLSTLALLLALLLTAMPLPNPAGAAPAAQPPAPPLFPGTVTVTGIDAPLRVGLGPERPIGPDMFAINGNLHFNNNPFTGFGIPLLPSFRQSGLALRYPAGTLGNYFDWDIGANDPQMNPQYYLNWVEPLAPVLRANRFNLDPHMRRFHDQTGSGAVMMLNMVTKDLEHSLRSLRRARDLGIPVRLVELGNELYIGWGGDPLVNMAIPSATAYAEKALTWARTIKAEFPDVQLAAVGAEVNQITIADPDRARRRFWNRDLLAYLRQNDTEGVISALVLHPYVESGLPVASSGADAEYANLADHAATAYYLARPGHNWEEALALSDLATPEQSQGLGLWVTEWNMGQGNSPVYFSWAHALFIANKANTLLADPRVGNFTMHNIAGDNNGFAAFFINPAQYFPFDVSGLDEAALRASIQRWTPTPPGRVMMTFAEAVRGADTAAPLTFAPSPTVSVTGPDDFSFSYPAVWGWAFSGAGGAKRLLVANVYAAPATLDLSALSVAGAPAVGAPFRQLAASPQAYLTSDAATAAATTTGTTGDSLALAPYSLTVVEIAAGASTPPPAGPAPVAGVADARLELSSWKIVTAGTAETRTGDGVFRPGDRLELRLELANRSVDTPAAGLTARLQLAPVLEAALLPGGFVASGATVTAIPGEPYAWQVSNLAPGQRAQIVVRAQVRGDVSAEITGAVAAALATTSADAATADDADSATVHINLPSTARLSAPATVYAGSTVTLDATASSDPGDDIAYYLWDFNGDGRPLDRDPTREDTSRVALTFAEPGERRLLLRTVDREWAESEAHATVTVLPACAAGALLDDFAGAQGGPGPGWSGEKGGYKAAGGVIEVSRGGPIYWKGEFGPDQVVCATLARLAPGGQQHGILLKVQEGNWRNGALLVSYNATTAQIEVSAYDPLTGWSALANLDAALADGAELAARATADGGLFVYADGAYVGRAQASAFAGLGGRAGLWAEGAAGAVLDDFVAGTVE